MQWKDPQYCQWVCKAALTTDSSGDSLKIFAAYVQHRWLLSLQNLVSQAKANSLLGQQLVVTGEPTELTRSTLEGLIRILGGKVTSKISEATAIVVAGSKQWNGEPVSESTKMQQAGLQPQHMPSHDLQTLPEAIARDIPLLTVDDFQAWVQKISTSKSSGQSKGKQRGKSSDGTDSVASDQSSDSSARLERAVAREASSSTSERVSQAASSPESPAEANAAHDASPSSANSPTGGRVRVEAAYAAFWTSLSDEEKNDLNKTTRSKIYDVLEGKGSFGSAYSFFLTVVILVNIASFVLSTEHGMDDYRGVFDKIETATVGIFTFEYLLRFSTRGGTCFSRLKWVFTNFFSIVDLISILPFYVDLAIPGRQSYLATQWVRETRYPVQYKTNLEEPEDIEKTPKFSAADAGGNMFTISMEKPENSLAGLTVAKVDDLAIQPMDRIIAVDDKSGSAEELLTALSNGSNVTVKLQHPRYFAVTLRKHGKPLGLEVEALDGPLGVVVLAVKEDGIIAEYNQTAPADKKIEAYCSIFAVNQKEWQGPSLLRMLQNHDKARLLRLLPPLPYDVIWKKSSKLLLASGFAGFTVICAALYYWFETGNPDMIYCPDEEFKKNDACWNRFHSIPAAMYYSVLNFFGEFPLADQHSLGGRFVMGAAVMAIPAGALGNAFSEVVEKEMNEEETEAADDAEAQKEKPTPKAGVAAVRCLDGERQVLLVAASSLHFILGTLRHLPSRLDELLLVLQVLDVVATATFSVEYVCSSSSNELRFPKAVVPAVLSVTGGAAAVLWVIFSTLMYYAEHHNPDPEMAAHYSSVSTSMWVTLLNLSGEAPLCEYTTALALLSLQLKRKNSMGTEAGKFISALMGLIGVGFVTIPMGTFPSFRQLVYKFLQGSAANQVEDLNPWEARFDPPGSFNRQALDAIEIVATLLFTLEYGLRYFCAPEAPEWAAQGYVSDRAARWSFATSASSIIDLLAIAPYYLALCGSSLADQYDGELRMLRIFRLLTLDKYIPSVSLIGRVFTKHAKVGCVPN
eukprot:g23781.t1